MRPTRDCQPNIAFIALMIILLLAILSQDSLAAVFDSIELYFYLLSHPSIEQFCQELMR